MKQEHTFVLTGSEVVKWVLGIASGLLVPAIIAGIVLIIQLDKVAALQQQEIRHMREAFEDVANELRGTSKDLVDATRTNSDRLDTLEERVEQVDETVRVVGRNLEDTIERRKSNP